MPVHIPYENKLIKLLFVFTAIGMGYVSYKLHADNNNRITLNKMKVFLSEEKKGDPERAELIVDFENEIQKGYERNRIAYVLDGTIIVFLTGLYFLTPKNKTNNNNT